MLFLLQTIIPSMFPTYPHPPKSNDKDSEDFNFQSNLTLLSPPKEMQPLPEASQATLVRSHSEGALLRYYHLYPLQVAQSAFHLTQKHDSWGACGNSQPLLLLLIGSLVL